jgi:hypothetical protein
LNGDSADHFSNVEKRRDSVWYAPNHDAPVPTSNWIDRVRYPGRRTSVRPNAERNDGWRVDEGEVEVLEIGRRQAGPLLASVNGASPDLRDRRLRLVPQGYD